MRDKFPTGLSRLEPRVRVSFCRAHGGALATNILRVRGSTDRRPDEVAEAARSWPSRDRHHRHGHRNQIMSTHPGRQRVASGAARTRAPVQASPTTIATTCVSNTWGLAALLAAALGPCELDGRPHWSHDCISVFLVYMGACTAKEQGTILVGVALTRPSMLA